MLGDFTTSNPTPSAIQAVSAFIGQKVFDHKLAPRGEGWINSASADVDIPSVYSGTIDVHRTYTYTACPGNVRNYLGDIRSIASTVNGELGPKQYPIITPLTISSANPAIGETVTASYRIVNTSPIPVTFGYIGVATRKNGANVDIGWQQNITIAPGAFYDVNVQRVITELGTYNYWASFMFNGVFYSALPQTNQTTLGSFVTHWPNVYATTMIVPNPTYPVAGQVANYKVTIYNGESNRINYAHLGIAARNTATQAASDIGWLDNTYLDPGASITLDFNKALPVGRYYIWTSIGIGSSFNSLWDAGGLNKIYMKFL